MTRNSDRSIQGSGRRRWLRPPEHARHHGPDRPDGDRVETGSVLRDLLGTPDGSSTATRTSSVLARSRRPRRSAVFGQQHQAEHQKHDHHRHGGQEHGAPPAMLQQHTPDQGADRGTGGKVGDVDRWPGCAGCPRNRLRINDRVEGPTVALATPNSARAAMRASAVGASAAAARPGHPAGPSSPTARRPARRNRRVRRWPRVDPVGPHIG